MSKISGIFSFIVHSEELMENLKFLHDSNIEGVSYTNDLVLKTFNLKNPSRRLAVTKDRFLPYSPVFIFRKKSPMTRVFNQQIQLLQQSGLIDYWKKERIDSHESKSTKTKPSSLELKSVLAAFQICSVLYMISCFLFSLELLSVKCQRIKQILDYFTY